MSEGQFVPVQSWQRMAKRKGKALRNIPASEKFTFEQATLIIEI